MLLLYDDDGDGSDDFSSIEVYSFYVMMMLMKIMKVYVAEKTDIMCP